jgi:hypothetical protein
VHPVSRHPSTGRVQILDEPHALTDLDPVWANSADAQQGLHPASTLEGEPVGGLRRVDPDPDDIEIITHAWLGVVGPHPSILTGLSLALIASVFAHLVIDLPSWWPYWAGAVALVVNVGLAYWQAGANRLVTVSNRGLRVVRKRRWSPELVEVVAAMPRMTLAQPGGRWTRLTMMRCKLWVHRRYHPIVESFDDHYRSLYRSWSAPNGSIDQPQR